MSQNWQWKPNHTKISYHIHRHYRQRHYPVLAIIGITILVLALLSAIL